MVALKIYVNIWRYFDTGALWLFPNCFLLMSLESDCERESVTFARVDRTVGKIVTWDFDVFFTVASLKVKSKFVFTGLAQA